MDIRVTRALDASPADRDVEIVERKGKGHPDTICDAVMDRVSVALCREYLRAHHNCDKGTLIAGQAEPRFGGGRILDPMRLIVGDRASAVPGVDVPAVAEGAAREWFRENLPRVDDRKHLRVQIELKPGSAPLTGLFSRETPFANDTSATVGYAPLTETERLVLDAERHLNSPPFRARFPDAGEDVKVMGVRTGRRLSLNVAVPLLDRYVTSPTSYAARMDELRLDLQDHMEKGLDVLDGVAIAVNALDRPDQGIEGLYLTVTGTSAEHADSGQVGRGNAVNGLISLHRPRGAEAAAGKNPVSHVGKIYNVLAHALARDLRENLSGTTSAVVWMCSRIGEPVDRPWIVSVELGLAPGADLSDMRTAAERRVQTRLAGLKNFCAELARGEHAVC